MFHVRKLGLWTALLATVLSVVMPPTLAHAQATSSSTTTRPPLSLTTSPIPLSIITQPGKTVTADLRVKNNGTQSENLKIDLLKFGASGTNGDPQLHDREAKDTYFDWVSFSEPTFVAEPNVWKTIHMTIKTPPSAAFGYYLAVLFSRANPAKPTGGNSGVEGGVASLVLLDVEAPGAKRTAEVSSLTASRKVYEFLPADLTIKLKNTGNVHVAPTGSIFIKRGSAQVGAPIDFNTQRGNILPGTERVFNVSWNDGFPHYETKVVGTKTTKTLKWDFTQLQNLRIGRYTATLVAVYDDGRRDIPVEGSVSFWVMPWRIIGVLFLILLFVGIGLWVILRGFWKNIRRSRQRMIAEAIAESSKTSTAVTAATPPSEPATTIATETTPPSDGASAAVTPAAPKPPAVNTTEKLKTAPDVPKTAPEIKD